MIIKAGADGYDYPLCQSALLFVKDNAGVELAALPTAIINLEDS